MRRSLLLPLLLPLLPPLPLLLRLRLPLLPLDRASDQWKLRPATIGT
jgi:hypothetical protein